MGNGSRIICKKEKQEWYCPQAYHSRFLAIPSAFVLLPGLPYSIPDVGGGQSPQKAINTMSYLLCKKTQKMYKIFSHGYTVNRRYLRQQQNHKFDSKILHIYFLSGRFIFQRHKNFYSLNFYLAYKVCNKLVYKFSVSLSLYLWHQYFHDSSFILCGRGVNIQLFKGFLNDIFYLCLTHKLGCILL